MRKITTIASTLTLLCVAAFAQQKGTFTDARDKKAYKTVKIGEQVWLAENLSYKAEGSKCYGEDGVIGKEDNLKTLPKAEVQANCAKYGRLYNWETAMKACPTGWHLPRKAEWSKLFRFIDSTSVDKDGNSETAGKHLKAKSGWKDYKGDPTNGTDTYGFSALPGGYHNNTVFALVGEYGIWWGVAIESKGHMPYNISSNNDAVSGGYADRSSRYSIRCINGDEAAALKADEEAIAEAKAKEAEAIARQQKEKEEAEAKDKAEGEAYIKANGGTFTDSRDKKTYKTIKINGQIWMSENLGYAAEKSKCYEDKPENCTKLGRLYNYETATKSCPAGWHLPKIADWDKLYSFADGASGTKKSPYWSNTAGKHLKATNGWQVDKKGLGNGTNKFGFSALPGGKFDSNKFNDINIGYWWTAKDDSGKIIISNLASFSL